MSSFQTKPIYPKQQNIGTVLWATVSQAWDCDVDSRLWGFTTMFSAFFFTICYHFWPLWWSKLVLLWFDSGGLAVWVEPKSSRAEWHWWLMAQMWLQVRSSWLWMTLTQLSHGSCPVWQSPDYCVACPLLPWQPTFPPASHLFYWPHVTMTMDKQHWSIGPSPLWSVVICRYKIYLYLHCWHNMLFYDTLVITLFNFGTSVLSLRRLR